MRSATICERHFTPESYERDLQHELLNLPLRKRLKKDAVPTINLLPMQPSLSAVSCDEGGEDSSKKRNRNKNFQLSNLAQELLTQYEVKETKADATTQCSLLRDAKLEKELTQTKVLLLQEQAKVRRLQKEVRRLKSRKCEFTCAKAMLRRNFSAAQTKKLQQPRCKWVHYSKDDIVAALVLRSISSEAFNHLYRTGPLLMPSRRTQERWLNKFQCNPGYRDDSLQVLKEMPRNSDDKFHEAVLCFDEMSIRKIMALERKTQTILGPYDKLQMVIMRGLCQK